MSQPRSRRPHPGSEILIALALAAGCAPQSETMVPMQPGIAGLVLQPLFASHDDRGFRTPFSMWLPADCVLRVPDGQDARYACETEHWALTIDSWPNPEPQEAAQAGPELDAAVESKLAQLLADRDRQAKSITVPALARFSTREYLVEDADHQPESVGLVAIASDHSYFVEIRGKTEGWHARPELRRMIASFEAAAPAESTLPGLGLITRDQSVLDALERTTSGWAGPQDTLTIGARVDVGETGHTVDFVGPNLRLELEQADGGIGATVTYVAPQSREDLELAFRLTRSRAVSWPPLVEDDSDVRFSHAIVEGLAEHAEATSLQSPADSDAISYGVALYRCGVFVHLVATGHEPELEAEVMALGQRVQAEIETSVCPLGAQAGLSEPRTQSSS